MHTTPAAYPWEVVSADLVGPLPRSKKGHTVVVVNAGTNLRSGSNYSLSDKPPPRLLPKHSARGWSCASGVHAELSPTTANNSKAGSLPAYSGNTASTIGYDGPPYTPQCNPVKRANRVIKTMIAQIHRWGPHNVGCLATRDRFRLQHRATRGNREHTGRAKFWPRTRSSRRPPSDRRQHNRRTNARKYQPMATTSNGHQRPESNSPDGIWHEPTRTRSITTICGAESGAPRSATES